MSDPAKARVVIRQMVDERAPGPVLAIIDDAQNIGVSTYFNAPGEFHMTLPIHHPQVGKCEPWRSHYAVEEYVNGAYVQKFEGVISDFDANENDIIIYGIDYLALLDRVIDTRYVQGAAETPPPAGSKYSSMTLSAIITDLLTYAKAKQDTPVRFIQVGPIDHFPETVTIYSTFVSIREMVDGLVQSHRQGTGKRSRFWCERTGGQSYRWRVADAPGVDRPDLRMEYGGLVQGFQVIGFGEWAAKAHGIGRTQTGYELFYESANAPGMNYTWASGYPAIETADVYDNVADRNDLQRRVKQKAMTASRIGKRIALGLRVEHLSPFDGYDIADNIPVHIQRGTVDTTRWGTGYWSIYGVEWRVSQDGHTETTLVVSPKEVDQVVNADTLGDNEALPAPIETTRIADGAIDTAKLAPGAVTGANVAPLSITTNLLADEAVSGPKIAPISITTDHIAGLDASVLKTGELLLGGRPDATDDIVVYDPNGVEISRWNAEGLTIADESDGSLMIRLAHGALQFSSNAGAFWTTAISADGITADAIRLGTFPGGSNRIENSGFEMAAFSAQFSKVWTLAADWTPTIGTDVNVTKNTGSLTLTDVAG